MKMNKKIKYFGMVAAALMAAAPLAATATSFNGQATTAKADPLTQGEMDDIGNNS